MATIYAYITRDLRGQDLADVSAESIGTDTFISSLIFHNKIIYQDISAPIRMNGSPID